MNELYHHGILGQKWGVRRYQYEDGSLTPEGKKRYGVGNLVKDTIADRYSRKAHTIRQQSIAYTYPYKEQMEYNNMAIRRKEANRDQILRNMDYRSQENTNQANRLKKLKYDDPNNVGKRVINRILDTQIKVHEGNADQWQEYEKYVKKFYDFNIGFNNRTNNRIERKQQKLIDRFENEAQKYDEKAKQIRG